MLHLTEKRRCRYAVRKILRGLPTSGDDKFRRHLAASYPNIAHAWTILPFCGIESLPMSELTSVVIDVERTSIVTLNNHLHDFHKAIYHNRTDTLEKQNATRDDTTTVPLRMFLSDEEQRPIDIHKYLVELGSMVQRSHYLFRCEDGHYYGRMGWYVYRDVASLTEGFIELLERQY